MAPYGHAAPAPMTSGLHVTAKFIFLQWMLFFVKPVVTIGGRPHSIPWNRPTVLPLPPGNHDVEIHFPWIGKGNPARMVVTVHPGHTTELRYHTKFFVFSPGDLRATGFRPWGA